MRRGGSTLLLEEEGEVPPSFVNKKNFLAFSTDYQPEAPSYSFALKGQQDKKPSGEEAGLWCLVFGISINWDISIQVTVGRGGTHPPSNFSPIDILIFLMKQQGMASLS
ncbi:MAG: hypothetical protein AB1589_25705 [Cyanobacteriota bacterium]